MITTTNLRIKFYRVFDLPRRRWWGSLFNPRPSG